MTSKINKLIVLILVVFSCLVAADTPGSNWKTHETSNFLIHYPDSLKHYLPQVVLYSEQSHDVLSTYFVWTPKKKTHLVLRDDFDQANGFAQSMPNNIINLFMQPPTSGELLAFDQWLKLLIHHEYTHILHMDKVLGLPSLIRDIFGRFPFSFPNTFHPNWFAEGLATYLESSGSNNVGRGNTTYFQIMMREELKGGIKPLSRINTITPHDWPLNTAYLYGVYFFKFIKDVYGEKAVKLLVHEYSDNIIPFRVDSNPKAVTGKSLSELWPDFQTYLQGYFSPQVQRITQAKETEYTVISDRHKVYGAPSISTNKDIWYSAIDHKEGPFLYKYSDATEIPILPLNSIASIDINANAKLLISQLENCGVKSQYFDLYLFDEEEKALSRLTQCGRYRLAKWVNNHEILGLRYDSGRPELVKLNQFGKQLNVIWKGGITDVVSSFDIEEQSINGEFIIVATIKFGSQNWGVYRLVGSEWQLIQSAPSIVSEIELSKGTPYYIQQYSGQSEFYKFEEGGETRLSHTYTGLKQTALLKNDKDEDDRAVGVRHSSAGDELVTFKLEPKSKIYLNAQDPRSVLQPEISRFIQTNSDKTYQSYTSMLPSYWFPVYLNNVDTKQIGFFTSGSDALQEHIYSVQLTSETVTDEWLLNFDYIYDSQLFLSVQQSIDYLGSSNLYLKSNQSILGYMKPLLSMSRQYYPFLAVTQSESYLFDKDVLFSNSEVLKDNWLSLGVIIDTFRQTRWSGLPSTGWQIKASMENADVVGNDLEVGTVFNFDFKFYQPVNGAGTVAQRLFVGWGVNSTSEFKLGGSQSNEYIGPGISVNKRRLPLRGYKVGIPELTGEYALLHSIEYRSPFRWVDYSEMAPPVGMNGWSFNVFLDSGVTSSGVNQFNAVYSSVGSEILLDTTLGYYLGLRARIGAAMGVGPIASDAVYFELGGSF